MARSTYVYVVDVRQVVVGTFTVKHEMLSAVRRALDAGSLRLEGLRIYRYPDGKLATPENITDQFVWGPPT